ncbi:MAG: glycosyltransferase, partial [Clostridia bacterium]|nr:glycosyltransferase [Clostridia bacterium]
MAPKVSFIIIAYNAAAHLDNILDDLKNQTFDHSLIEVILVDSKSTDNTAKIFDNFKINNDFLCCKTLDNPKKVLPAGWNIALDNADGEIILRVDAHSRIP